MKIRSKRIFGKGDNDLPYYLSSYIDLVDETGQVIRDDKAGYIAPKLGSALPELELNPDNKKQSQAA